MNFDLGRLRASRFAIVALPAAAAALLAAGCGEKEEPAVDGPVVPITTTATQGGQDGDNQRPDGGGSQGDNKRVSGEKAVQDAIERFLTSPNADRVCRELLTPLFLRRAYGSVAGCKSARRPATLAASAQISGLRMRGTSAEAKARPNGGVNDDERLTFQLQRSGQNWLIANVRSNARVGP